MRVYVYVIKLRAVLTASGSIHSKVFFLIRARADDDPKTLHVHRYTDGIPLTSFNENPRAIIFARLQVGSINGGGHDGGLRYKTCVCVRNEEGVLHPRAQMQTVHGYIRYCE